MSHDRQPDTNPENKLLDKTKGTADFYEALEQLEDVFEGTAGELAPDRADSPPPHQAAEPSPASLGPPPEAPPVPPDPLAFLEAAIADIESFLNQES